MWVLKVVGLLFAVLALSQVYAHTMPEETSPLLSFLTGVVLGVPATIIVKEEFLK